jgi:hypothetical protein
MLVNVNAYMNMDDPLGALFFWAFAAFLSIERLLSKTILRNGTMMNMMAYLHLIEERSMRRWHYWH